MQMDLNTILFVLLGTLVAGYALLDGFDLGVGAVLLLRWTKEERDLLVASICPVWDGNQVWLLAIADVLFGAFPLVFVTVFSGFYIVFMLVLVAIIARTVAIEYRHMRPSSRWLRFWDYTLGGGCLALALLLGVAVGNILRGAPIGAEFAWKGNFLGLLNPYAILIGVTICTLFTMHGAVYLRMKTDGELSDRINRIALRIYVVFLLLFAVSVAATAHVSPSLFRKVGNHAFLGLAALLAAALASVPLVIRSEIKGAPFISSSAIIASLIALIALSTYPVLIPSIVSPELSLTIYNAASSQPTLLVMLIVACIGMPIMLGYTFAVYRIFKGPARLPSRS
jgi:cytochrome d ubiquinol oxidase subunit II